MIRLLHQYVAVKSLVLMGFESILILTATALAVELRFWGNAAGLDKYTRWPEFGYQLIAVVVTFQISFYYNDLYNIRSPRSQQQRILGMMQGVGLACILLGVAYLLLPDLFLGRGVLFITVPLLTSFLLISRFAVEGAWRAAVPAHNVIVLGAQQLGRTTAREILKRRDLNLNIVGFVGTRGDEVELNGVLEGRPILGSEDDLEQVVRLHRVDEIIVAQDNRRNSLPMSQLLRFKVEGIKITEAASMVSGLTGRVWLDMVQPSWFVFSDGFRRSALTSALKRLLDLGLSLTVAVLTAPLMALIAIAIRLDSAGPVIYRQKRVGLREKPFEMMKFRSMNLDAEDAGIVRSTPVGDRRVTRVGRILRKFRLDELPQLWNIIRGDMSLVGPRPERPEFVQQLDKAIPCYAERHTVRPGLTGWAQVNYGYGGSVEDARRKLEYDLFYLKHMSISMDLAIIVQTGRIVLSASGS